ncbi:MAG: exopolyphosphatase / guanosine-5-triphosphate,3-diphosphate pyrophosphatase [Thermoleophilaceae bacterium]|jgi:exopolyphosphatase/guanosine-5'-triphosphate,3'-diphosphate pyrophosphatase|nr:exopolyphosphatase / guanosine-5-triphosphate,3-diphosphate pyrophosphatase [Thermoleophilaceae bacterium]
MPSVTTSTRVAIVDLGTNTTRLLVADVSEGRVQELERLTTITRLGEGVDATGRLAEGAMDRVRAAVAGYREKIDAHGATTVRALATSAMRDAANGEDFRHQLTETFGIEPLTIPGTEEARLTFLGATSARPAGGPPVLVLDIGGGSTEYTVGVPGRAPDFSVSTQAGSVRQTERFLLDDPPTAVQLEALATEVLGIVRAEVPEEVRTQTGRGIAVAGTATSFAAISMELDPYDPQRVDGYELTLAEAERITAWLAAMPLAEREQIVTGLHPERAPTIVAGAVILVESMRAFELDSVEVSEADILHGAALDAAETT